jgi:putative MATE family efflux protein
VPTAEPSLKPGQGLYTSVANLAWPASLEFLIITSIIFADILFLSRLGTEILAGVGIAVTVFRIFYEPFNSVALATTTVVAQAYGARNRDLACQGAGQSVLLALILGFISGGIGVLVARLAMIAMGGEGLVRESGVLYMQINLMASPFYAVALAGGGALKGVGDTRTPMLYTLAGAIFKIALSAGLVFGLWGFPELGVKGAAIGSVCGYGLNALLIALKLSRGFDGMRLGVRAFLPDFSLLWRIIRLAWPVAAERMVMRMGFIFYMRVVAALGTVVLAANQIALRLESVSLTVGFGFTIAATTLVGQAVGRRDLKSAHENAWATMKLSVAVAAVMTVVLILIRHWAVAMFKPDADVREIAVSCLVIGAFELPAFAVLFTFAGALRGAGDTRSPMIVALIGTFIFRLPLVYLLGVYFGLGLKGIWYGTLIDWIGRATLMYFIFRSGRWKDKAFVEDEEIARPLKKT